MTAQRLDRVLTAYRIGDPNGKFPIFDATGSKLFPGRWNTRACPMIYAAQHYSTALLEKLVHGSGALPPNQHFISITIPNGVRYESLDPAFLPDWAHIGCVTAKAHGDAWQRARRSAILLVPSELARMEQNILINPEHADFGAITCSLHQPVRWDQRLFGPG